MTNNPADVCNDGRRVSHRDHHVGICHRRYEHRPGLELKRLFNVEHEVDGARSRPGAGRHSGENGVSGEGRCRPGARVAGECSRDRPGLDDVQHIVVDDPLDVLRRAETFLQLFGDLGQLHGHGQAEAGPSSDSGISSASFSQSLSGVTSPLTSFSQSPSTCSTRMLGLPSGPAKRVNMTPERSARRKRWTTTAIAGTCLNPNLPEVGEGARRENGCPNFPNCRFKFFRSADRYRFKNSGERMCAAVLNRSRRTNDHAFARLLPKPQGIDRLQDRLRGFAREFGEKECSDESVRAVAVVSSDPASSESSVSSAGASPMSSRAL